MVIETFRGLFYCATAADYTNEIIACFIPTYPVILDAIVFCLHGIKVLHGIRLDIQN
jgi:hypothetical protein